MSTLLAPPLTPPAQLPSALRNDGHAVLSAAGLCELVSATPQALDALRGSWDDLPPDAYLRDGGRYRRRRHACYIVEGDALTWVPKRPHWQPLEYNALHGGLERWFEPIAPAVADAPAWAKLITGLAAQCSAASAAASLPGGKPTWYVEAHQFRIDTTDGIGRPTPEGAHRDGVDFVAVSLVDRVGVKGGETRVFDADGPTGLRFTLTEPWTTLLLDDRRVIHESTPIQPLAHSPAPSQDQGGHRDTLVITFRAGSFQGPGVA